MIGRQMASVALALLLLGGVRAAEPGLEEGITEANALLQRGALAEASESFRQILRDAERSGADGVLVAVILNNLGMACQDLGQYREAERMYRRSLRVHRAAAGEDSPGLVHPLHNLATLYNDMHRPSNAEPLFRQALALLPEWMDKERKITARFLTGLAEAQYHQEKHEEAEANLLIALEVLDTTSGAEIQYQANALNVLASVYAGAGRLEDALPLQREAVAKWEEALGPGNRQLVKGLANLGGICADAGRYAEAETHYKRSAAIAKKELGKDHPATGMVLMEYAALLHKMSRKREAKTMKKQASKILTRHREENLLQHSVDASEFRSFRQR